jgi:hypothetical protein
VEIVLAELNRHKSKITHLNDCSVSDAAPVLIKLGFAQLLAIEANTKRDLKIEPSWDELWEAQCGKLSIPKAKNHTWRETWAIAESKRKKYASPAVAVDNPAESKCMTPNQVEIMKAREEWRKKLQHGPPVVGGPPRKKSKYR